MPPNTVPEFTWLRQPSLNSSLMSPCALWKPRVSVWCRRLDSLAVSSVDSFVCGRRKVSCVDSTLDSVPFSSSKFPTPWPSSSCTKWSPSKFTPRSARPRSNCPTGQSPPSTWALVWWLVSARPSSRSPPTPCCPRSTSPRYGFQGWMGWDWGIFPCP